MKRLFQLADLRVGLPGEESIRFGVLGDPVAHSRSPEMQNAALEQIGSGGRYARFQIAPNELAEALELMAALGFRGANLTVPHKTAGLSLVDDADELARAVGAINTIVFRDGRRLGANTDGPGFERAIEEVFDVALSTQRVLLLGAGGAGRAIAVQCARAGCRSLVLANRNSAKAEVLARDLPCSDVVAVPWSEKSLGAALARSDLVVQATSLGLRPEDPSPLSSAVDIEPRHLVYDLVTQPTALLADARRAGAATANGLTMLLHQGALAFELWTGERAPLDKMRAALDD